MGSVIPVIEAEAIRGHIQQSDTRAEVAVRFRLIDEAVLAPVADHQTQSQKSEGEEIHEQRGAEADIRSEEVVHPIGAEFEEGGLGRHAPLASADEGGRQVHPHEEAEARDVEGEVRWTVALVADGGGDVIGPVPFDMVVLDVVEVVGVPGVAEEGIEEVGEGGVEEGEAFGEDATLVDVLVHH